MSSYSHFSNGFLTPSSSSASNVATTGNTSISSIPLPGGGQGQMMTSSHSLPPKFIPSLRMKTNELFYRWFSEPERYEQIREIIHFIKTSGKMPKPSDLQTFKNDPNTSSYGRSLYPQPNSSSSSSSVLEQQQHQQQYQQQLAAQQQMYLQAPKSSSSSAAHHHHRSKSPPSLQSPPMSPISRMPNSPKSPRQRQNMMMLQNNNGNGNNAATTTITPTNGTTNAAAAVGSGKQPATVGNTRFANSSTKGAAKEAAPSPLVTTASTTNVIYDKNKPGTGENYPSLTGSNTPSKAATTATAASPVLSAKQAAAGQKDSSSQRASPLLAQNENAKPAKPGTTTTNLGTAGLDQPYSSSSSVANNKSNAELAQQQLLYNNNNNNNQTPTPANQLNSKNDGKVFNSPTSPTSTTPTGGSTVKSIGSAITNLIKMPNNRVQQQKSQPQAPQQQLNVPQFYFPNGRPEEKHFKDVSDAETMRLVNAEFRNHKDGKLFKDDFSDLLKLIGLPRYWKILLFRSCTNSTKLNYVVYSTFEQVWSKLTSACHDRTALFMKLIAANGQSITHEDWEPLMQDIVDTHPGLRFLHDHKEFHTRYIKTVIARIYYTVNRSWSGRITLAELKKSNFLPVLESLDAEEDINLIKDYFSYEHFYVIYCKFWELDKDHDLLISKEDLYRHNNYAISSRVIDRIFSGTVIRGKDWREGLMSYYDFVWFLMSEEDKRNATSVEYWFRILDLDGDGVLSMYELEYFYNEQIEQMRERQIEYMPFNDLLCQILDLVKPLEAGKIRLKDLKQCKMSNVFFDTFINLEKYLEYEQRDPFSNIRDLDGPELSDWEKYAADEYENLVSEDVNGEAQECYNQYEDDFEDEPLLFNSMNMNQLKNGHGGYPGSQQHSAMDDANGFINTGPSNGQQLNSNNNNNFGGPNSNAGGLTNLLDSLTNSNSTGPTALIDTNPLNGNNNKQHSTNGREDVFH